MATEFTLPSLGENITGGDVLRVLVKPGDTIEEEQPVVELETDKATIEVPSSVAGVVKEVRVKEGDKLAVGQVVLIVEGGDAAAQPPEPATGKEAASDSPPTKQKPAPSSDASQSAAAGSGDDTRPSPASGRPAKKKSSAKPAAKNAPSGPVEFKLPSLGEDVKGGDVLRVLVKAGDEVAQEQAVLELETDKATIEVPSSVAGVVREVKVKEGDKIEVGAVVLVLDGSAAGAADAPPADEESADSQADASDQESPEAAEGDAAGDERRSASPLRRQDKPGMLADAVAEAAAHPAPRRSAEVIDIKAGRGGDTAPSRVAAAAAPSVRRLARELGVDIHGVPGSGPAGRISVEDVKAFVKSLMTSGRPAGAGGPAIQAPSLPDFSKWGEIERKPMRAVRRTTAERLTQAWQQIPHVTQGDRADLTVLDELRKRYAADVEAAGGKLTVTAIALKAVAGALRKFPQFNSSVDMSTSEIIYKHYVNIGVAVDTERGLLVPVIRDVDKKNIVELSVELARLSEKTRAGKATLEEMQGGSFTISNLGGIGGTYFTPIVNLPEVAILGMSRGSMEPVFIDGEFRPRLMLPLSLSYDHRVIDGADAIRFLRFVCDALEHPFVLSLFG